MVRSGGKELPLTVHYPANVIVDLATLISLYIPSRFLDREEGIAASALL